MCIGNVDKGVVEVTNCFCVPHKEHDDQVEAELSYALDLYELNKRVNSSEVIVGTCFIVAHLHDVIVVVVFSICVCVRTV